MMSGNFRSRLGVSGLERMIVLRRIVIIGFM